MLVAAAILALALTTPAYAQTDPTDALQAYMGHLGRELDAQLRSAKAARDSALAESRARQESGPVESTLSFEFYGPRGKNASVPVAADAVKSSKTLAEERRFEDAAEVARDALKSGQEPPDRQRALVEIIEACAAAAKAEPALQRHARLHAQARFSGPLEPLRRIVAFWRDGAAWSDRIAAGELLAVLLRDAEDPEGVRLTREWLVSLPEAPADLRADQLLTLGNMAQEAQRLDEARERWGRVEAEFPGTPAWPEAVFKLGWLLQNERRHDDAIRQFGKVLAPNPAVDDQDPGWMIADTYRSYRSSAMWAIGDCRFATGDYAGAMDAYETTEKTLPFHSSCGNQSAANAYKYAYSRGLCLEHLGRPADAVLAYWRAAFGATESLHPKYDAHLRLLALYDQSGQLDDLRHMLDQTDAAAKQRHEASSKRPISDASWRGWRPTVPMRQLLELREWATRGEWRKLAEKLTGGAMSRSPSNPLSRRDNVWALEAARLLAEHPAESLPVVDELLAAGANQWGWYALGRMGTPKALKTLRAVAEKSMEGKDDIYAEWADTIVYSLSLAGPRGQAVIAELGAAHPSPNLSRAIQGLAEGRFDERKQPQPLPQGTRLPTIAPD